MIIAHRNAAVNALRYIVSVSCCFFFLRTAFAEVQIPTIVDPVTDLTETLNKIEYTNLRKEIIRFEDSTSNQIVVVILPTLGGYEIRDFGIRLLDANKIGQKGKDNGILILVAKEDRKVSIEVGYGLEGVLTDALCDQIIRNEIRPRFRDGEYYAGISQAITSIMQVTRGEYAAEASKKANRVSWLGFAIIAAVLFFSMIAFFRGRRYGISSRGSNAIWWTGSGFGSGTGYSSFGGGGGGGGWSAGGGSFGGGGASGSW